MFFISIALFNRARQRPAAGRNYIQQLTQRETMTGVAEANRAAGLPKGDMEEDQEHCKALPKHKNKTREGTSDSTRRQEWLLMNYFVIFVLKSKELPQLLVVMQ